MRLGYYPEAIRAFEKALASASGESPERQEQRRVLKVYLAEALTADWQLARAADTLKDIGDLSALPARERQLGERVVTEIAQKKGDLEIAPARLREDGHRPADLAAKNSPPSRTAVRAALVALDRGDDTEAIAQLGAAAGAHPADPLPRFLMGKIHFDRGRFADAERELDAAHERAPDSPPWMAGWIELYHGLVEKTRTHGAAAQAHFRAASEVRRFRSAERGILELQEGVAPHGRCRP